MANHDSPDRAAPDHSTSSECYDRLSVTPAEHYITGVFGLVLTVLLSILLYPWLATMVDPMAYLSSTILVFTVASLWIVVWLVLVLLWEWRAGRLLTS